MLGLNGYRSMTSIFLIRDVIERLFSDAIEQRKEDIQQNSDVARSLTTFQKYGNDQISTAPNTGRINPRGGGFFSGVLTALTGVAVSFVGMVFHIRLLICKYIYLNYMHIKRVV